MSLDKLLLVQSAGFKIGWLALVKNGLPHDYTRCFYKCSSDWNFDTCILLVHVCYFVINMKNDASEILEIRRGCKLWSVQSGKNCDH